VVLMRRQVRLKAARSSLYWYQVLQKYITTLLPDDCCGTLAWVVGLVVLGVALKWSTDGVIEPARELAGQVDGALDGAPPPDLPGWLRKAADAYAEKQLQRDELGSKDQATREGLTLYLMMAGEQARRRLIEQQDPAELERACAAIDAIFRAETYLDANVNTAVALQQLALALERK